MSAARKVVLFTAQEPSGDAHAAPVIARLREAYPDIEPVAWGGPKMAAAGATMLGRTADDGVMGLAGISKVAEVKRLHDEIVAWARANPVAVHMPVDSPSANYPLCARLRPLGARIVNLVAPQLWAWAPWRIRKVRRLSDVMLCLLPFEEEWFRSRGVTAKFVGHPVLSKPLELARCAEEAKRLPQGSPRVLLLPGSRSSEVRRNGRLLADIFALVRAAMPGARAVAVASNEANAQRFRAELGDKVPEGVDIVVSGREVSLEGALAWCDLALAVSGTVSLDCTRQAKPMIGVYRTSLAEALGAKLVIRAPSLLLPNILAGRRIVPEFVPYAGNARRIAAEALSILGDRARSARIERDLRTVADQFLGRDPAPIVAEIVAREARGTRVDDAALDEIVRAFS
jgi:lipid-A-disaccharide synthase